jgi:beta-xylosidase
MNTLRPWGTVTACLALMLTPARVPRNPATPAAPTAQPSHATAAHSYRNPILFADYSDPDVIRDGARYYLIASTFHFVPGIPILESPDLVHWTILGHAVPRLDMSPRYSMIGGNGYGMGVWAPSIRKHDGIFYIYFPTPTEGIFVTTAPSITGPWTTPHPVIAQPGLEDPCPFWDDDGTAYLIHSKTGAGPLILHRMSPDGTRVLDTGKIIVDDPTHLPTLEGPKLYKRDGFYYIFAPFGGVNSGSQAVLRSRQIYGPYESRVVLAQGDTKINGPHQGGYVETPTGQGWFIHFQFDGAHGRIVHLEPVRWQDDWPIIGQIPNAPPAPDDPIIGSPVATGPLPTTPQPTSHQTPQTSDEFSSPQLAPQWEWNHNPDDTAWSLTARPGYLRLSPTHAADLLSARNTLTQSMQDNAFTFTVRLDLTRLTTGVHTGLAMFEKSASGLEVVQTGSPQPPQAQKTQQSPQHQQAEQAPRQLAYFHLATRIAGPPVPQNILQLRVEVNGDQALYSFSLDDGRTFHPLGPATPIHFSWWKGSRPALFAYTTQPPTPAAANPPAVDIDWAHYQPQGTNPW